MICGDVENDQAMEASEFFVEIKRNALLDEERAENNRDWIQSVEIILLCVVNGLSQLGMSSIAQSIEKVFAYSLFNYVLIQNALIDMRICRERFAHSFCSLH